MCLHVFALIVILCFQNKWFCHNILPTQMLIQSFSPSCAHYDMKLHIPLPAKSLTLSRSPCLSQNQRTAVSSCRLPSFDKLHRNCTGTSFSSCPIRSLPVAQFLFPMRHSLRGICACGFSKRPTCMHFCLWGKLVSLLHGGLPNANGEHVKRNSKVLVVRHERITSNCKGGVGAGGGLQNPNMQKQGPPALHLSIDQCRTFELNPQFTNVNNQLSHVTFSYFQCATLCREYVHAASAKGQFACTFVFGASLSAFFPNLFCIH